MTFDEWWANVGEIPTAPTALARIAFKAGRSSATPSPTGKPASPGGADCWGGGERHTYAPRDPLCSRCGGDGWLYVNGGMADDPSASGREKCGDCSGTGVANKLKRK